MFVISCASKGKIRCLYNSSIIENITVLQIQKQIVILCFPNRKYKEKDYMFTEEKKRNSTKCSP